MDTNSLVESARQRFKHAAARRILEEKYQARMVFAHAGGMWQAGPELLTVLANCPDQAVILDLNRTPVQVQSQELYKLTQQRWQEQMTAWLIEFQENEQRR